MKRRCSFTLAEVLISLLVVGGAFSFFLPAIQGALSSYTLLRQAEMCQYLADEYFSTTLIDCIQKPVPKEIVNFSRQMTVPIGGTNYSILLTIQPDPESKEEDHIVKFQISVSLNNVAKGPQAIRETKLCVLEPQ